ncbi:MAG: glycosyltransferase family 39 protein [Bryobacteraceae bacterium]
MFSTTRPPREKRADFPVEHARRNPDVWAVVAACALSVFFLLTSLYIAQHRLLWYDEVITARVSRLSWPGETFHFLKTGLDQQPLPFYLLVRLSALPLGFSAFSLRLPSALAMCITLLVTFDCVRRLTDGLHGLLALSFLTCSVLPFYGSEARPYALICMWSACSLWLWVHTRRESWAAALFFGLAVFGSIVSHYYAIFCLVPYVIVTLSEVRDKGVPPKIVAACVAAGAGLALIAPFVKALRGLSAGFWAPASIGALNNVFVELFPRALVLLPLMLIWIAVATVHSRKIDPAAPMAPAERLAWLFLLIPFAAFLVAILITNAFYHRYFIGVLPGVAVGFSCLIWRHFRRRITISAGILCLLSANGILLSISEMDLSHPEHIGPPTAREESAKVESLLRFEDVLSKEGKQFVVVPLGHHLAIEALYYTKHPERYRLLDDATLSNDAVVSLDRRLAPYFPMHFWTVNDLKEHAREAALTDCTDAELLWTEQMGLRVQARLIKPLNVTYLK